MTGAGLPRRGLLGGAAATLFAASARAAAPGPEGPERGRLREQVFRVPIAVRGQDAPLLLVATVFRPPGPGPFPLALVNHGSPRSAADRRAITRHRYSAASAWFVARGYAVAVPSRRGYATSEGDFIEGPGPCAAPRYEAAGETSANDIAGCLAWFRQQPFVAPESVVLVGQSAGGWGVLALAARGPPGVRCVLNFAGGRGSPSAGVVCAPDRLAQAAAAFGARTRIPSLWIYARNDTYQPPEVSQRVAAAYRGAGGPASYHLLPPFKQDGHGLFADRDGVPVWAPLVAPFLVANGLD